ncbi:hypothetical protein K461DRAFT_279533 [Myriangium duriaei CBS 260.36]|uniref:Uncharacterized protein n=1 Tax=Myriangium duriaei CBS 260.36 TaxID=1168546 RepID=A0A9P4MGC5_9PEZI|nr:hypothetical protein K461DRAFT_279533 [Myriangium duriaei CBS 260.36]
MVWVGSGWVPLLSAGRRGGSHSHAPPSQRRRTPGPLRTRDLPPPAWTMLVLYCVGVSRQFAAFVAPLCICMPPVLGEPVAEDMGK